jgi:hypothetical protein
MTPTIRGAPTFRDTSSSCEASQHPIDELLRERTSIARSAPSRSRTAGLARRGRRRRRRAGGGDRHVARLAALGAGAHRVQHLLVVAFDARHGEPDQLADGNPRCATSRRGPRLEAATPIGVRWWGSGCCDDESVDVVGPAREHSPDDERLTVSSGASHGLAGKCSRRTNQPQNPPGRRAPLAA